MPERRTVPAEVADVTPSIPPELCFGLFFALILTNSTPRPSRSHKPLPSAPRSAWQQAPHTRQLTHLYGVQAEKNQSK